MLQRLLIANRGEIACRIARTARRLGIHTIAVCSDADADALHVRSCDEAVLIGGRTPAESYLRGDRILEAARRTGAVAVHPGYGFLSENADFAEACADAGLVFVGPPPAAIRAMGSKSEAKALMARAGVPLTPGYHGEDQDPRRLQQAADELGYPVLIKASAGGGGRGMRRVERPEDFAGALAGCRREAAASFGDDRVLVERYVLRPRHIELQVFADSHGHCLHLFERDCSVQRRHQKVLEEAPAPGMTAGRRAAMGAAAVEAARAVGYVGAGTVEFIVAPDGNFYFMEMNTRLQVEHPVTEMITGLDLVEWQLRIASGEPLPLNQEQLRHSGHAVEARIYAEDPARGFLPSVGRLEYFATPSASRHVRIDAGVAQGDAITPYYDSMIAKLITWDRTREQAIVRLRTALREVRIVGVASNVDFLGRLAASPAFTGADLDTALIEREHDLLFPAPQPPRRELWLAAAAAILLKEAPEGLGAAESPWGAVDGWRLGGRAQRTIYLRAADVAKPVLVSYEPQGWSLLLDGSASRVEGQRLDDGRLQLTIDGARSTATVVRAVTGLHVFMDGATCVLAEDDPLHMSAAAAAGAAGLCAPMPGRVIELLAAPGAQVARGAPLLVLEAMKIEHTIVAPDNGTLRAFRVAAGEQVAEGVELVDFEAEA
jgi:3-methylcrotonyl-CoA carboxylase alpha subunit